jgi:hypothetical protein
MSVFEHVSSIFRQNLKGFESFSSVKIDIFAALLIVDILPMHCVRAGAYSRMSRFSLIRHKAYIRPSYATRRIPIQGTLFHDAVVRHSRRLILEKHQWIVVKLSNLSAQLRPWR